MNKWVEWIGTPVRKYKELILYVIFGGFTTLINIVVYWICRNLLVMPIIPADVLAWILAVIFAFVTNKIWVFESKTWDIKKTGKEFAEFIAARLFSLGVDVVFLKITVDGLHWPDLWMKLLANVIVVVLNYIFSKLLIFRKEKKETK